ncbi:PREDICTED: vesicular acetylcholine transporter-like [Rhagoletis zephyria]|uniref:vesicular acetylcholine transporter-like n=1 Tax=Rhagoletis zephyria TaxID=28612 RepID=UPI000811677E|nr:PREDICTED: vesicular acetylcholine transporter-like [Rhagoletis zephyria]
MPFIPILNQDTAELWKRFNEKIEEPRSQRRIILFIVCVALLLDNMLYMVIVPIIPDYLRKIGAWDTHLEGAEIEYRNVSSKMVPFRFGGTVIYEGEDSAVGMLFASKAIVQLFINPFSGAIIDRIGYDIPMMIGLCVMFFSTAVFACGQSYGVLFLARSLQGVGSAFADTAGMAMIADRFTEENERQKALAMAIAFISFGSLVAPPFGGILYQIAGKEVPFIILSLVCLIDAMLLKLVMQPTKERQDECSVEKPAGTPIHTLLMDPHIACVAGALVIANVSLAFLEPTISLWMEDNMHVEEWQMGLIWLPAFFPHVLGVYSTVALCDKYPRYQWFFAAAGLAIEGVCSLILPFATSFWFLILPISGICYGIALVDTSLLPTLGYLVDLRYVSVYGSIYAIADISYSLAYAVGPVIAGSIVESIGFTALNLFIALVNLLYVPVLAGLRRVYDYEQFEAEQIGMTEQTNGTSAGGSFIQRMAGHQQQHQQQQQQKMAALGYTSTSAEQTHLQGNTTGGYDQSGYAATDGAYQAPVVPSSKYNPFSAAEQANTYGQQSHPSYQ